MLLLHDLPRAAPTMNLLTDPQSLALAGLTPVSFASVSQGNSMSMLPFFTTVSSLGSLQAPMVTVSPQPTVQVQAAAHSSPHPATPPSAPGSSSQSTSAATPNIPERRVFNELCVVCGDRATGLHYNVASCNGCKTFFRRTIICNRSFKCHKGGNCLFNKDIRCACRACRFQKCLKVGMNPRAIQSNRAPGGIHLPGTLSSSPNSMQSGSLDLSALLSATSAAGLLPSSSGLLNGLPTTSRPITPLSAPSSSSNPASPTPEDRAFAIGISECDEIVADLLAIDGKMGYLRQSSFSGGPLLDILTRPPAINHIDKHKLLTEMRVFPSEQARVEFLFNFELAISIEFAKTHSIFRQLSFIDKCVLLEDTVLALFLLNGAYDSWSNGRRDVYYADGTPATLNDDAGCPGDLIDALARCAPDRPTFVLVKALTFLNPEAYGLSAEAKTTIEAERRRLMHAMGTYVFHRFGKRGPSLLGESLFLPAAALAMGRRVRANPPASVPLLYFTTPMPTVKKEEIRTE